MTEERSAAEYLGEFTDCIKLNSAWPDTRELYKWCEENMGVKYRDWFMFNTNDGRQHGHRANKSIIYIKNPKRATVFRLRWIDLIEHNIDIPD